ncbi:MAG: caspase family protein [Saprospiraceae bacterium]
MKFNLLLIILFYSLKALCQPAHLVIPKGHTEGITSLSCSHSGKYVLSGSKDQSVILWSPAGQEIENIKVSQEVDAVAFSANEKLIAVGTIDGKIKVYKIEGSLVLTINAHTKSIHSVAFSPNGLMILSSSSDNTAKIWDLNGKLINTFKHKKPIRSAAFSYDGKLIVTGSEDSTGMLWNLAGKKLLIFNGHTGPINQVIFGRDNKSIASCSEDSTAIIWNLDGSRRLTLNLNGNVASCNFSTDGNTFITGCNSGLVTLWSKSGQILHSFLAHDWGLNSVFFTPNDKNIMSCSEDKEIKMFDLKGNLIQQYHGHSHDVYAACFSRDGKFILTGNGDHTAKIWDILNYNYKNFKGHQAKVLSVDISPNDQLIVTGSEDKTAKLWDIKGKILKTLNLPDEVNSVSFSNDGKSILTGCINGYTKLWNLSGKEIQVFKQDGEMSSTSFLPDGKSIVSSTKNGVIKQFDLSGKIITTFNSESPVHSMTSTADGKNLLLSTTSGQSQLWDLQSGSKLKSFGNLKNPISSVAISQDGKYIASGDNEGKIELHKKDSNSFHLLLGHTSKIFSLSFSADGKYLISASEDETTKLWHVDKSKELATLISIDDTDWVVTTPHGYFDASEGAMYHMDYVVGLENIELEQLKERYYEPGLLEESFELIETEFHDVPTLKNVALYPELIAYLEKDKIRVKLKSRSGGIGKLSVFVNHKEVNEDINPTRNTEILINLNAYEKYYTEDSNVISLRVYNKEGWLESKAHNYYYFPYKGSKGSEGNGTASKPISHKGKPKLFALVVGTSDYSGENLDLRFPDLDAAAIADGLKAVAKKLFEDRVEIKLLSTAGTKPEDISSRINIEKALKDFATKSSTGDIVIAYFSGHGTTYGQAEKNQFYYLTKDIKSENLSDPEIRNNYTVSSDDLTKWLTAIPAQKEVLIFDACHSGKAVEALSALGAKDLSPSQIKALDRMKDRSGIFIISGSAADAVSYEASTYGQGLLTYSLLQGMSGLSLTEDNRVDLSLLFQFALDKVPEYAKSINKVQVPIVAFPHGSGSFDIGIVDSTVKIKLAQPKPVFIRNIFLDETSLSDHLNITGSLSNYFREITAQGADANLIFVDVNEYENAYSLRGLYNLKGDNINLRARVFLGSKSIGEFQITSKKGDNTGLIELILEKTFTYIKN